MSTRTSIVLLACLTFALSLALIATPVRAQDAYHDGDSDILWSNTSTGDIYLWDVNITDIVNQGYVAYSVGTQWQVAGGGDFYNDGNTDILWYNSQTGDVYVWEL